MLVVRIELHSAITGQVKEIGRTIIYNDGRSSDPKKGDYGVRVARKTSLPFDNQKVMSAPLRNGEVKDYPRLSYNVWRLWLWIDGGFSDGTVCRLAKAQAGSAISCDV